MKKNRLLEKIKRIFENEEDRINELILNIKGVDLSKYLVKRDFHDTVIPLPETKDGKKRRLEKEKIYKASNERILKIAKKLEEKKNQYIFKLLFETVSDAFEKDSFILEFFKDEFTQKVMVEIDTKVYDYIDADIQLEKLEDYDMGSLKELKEFKLFCKISKSKNSIGESIVENGAVFEAIRSLLDDINRTEKAKSWMKEVIFHLYDQEGIWKSLNKQKLKKISEKLGIKEVNEDNLANFLESLNEMIKGKLSAALEQNCRGTERKLRKIIKMVLNKEIGKDWLKIIVSKEEYSKIMGQMKSDKVGMSNESSEYLNIAQCKNILENKWAFFKRVFLDSEENQISFVNKIQFFSALNLLRIYRNPLSHARDYKFKYGDRQQLENLLIKINKCIDGFLKKKNN